jgi:integrase
MSHAKITVWVQAFTDRDNLALQWVDPATGRRRTRTAGTSDRTAAEQKARDLEYELRHGTFAEPSKMSWPDFVAAYTAEKLSGNRPATRVKAERVLRHFAKYGGVKRIADADERAVSRFIAGLRTREQATATIAGSLAYLAAALQWAEDQGFLPKRPKITLPKYHAKRPRTISLIQFTSILDAAPSDVWRAFLWTAWHSGMRRTELLSLVWDQHTAAPWVDFAAKRIWIPAAFNKSNADQWIPLHRKLAAILKPLRQPSGPMFPLATPDVVTQQFIKLAASVGVKATLHDIRRTFGTRYAPIVPAHILQRLMRHSDIKTTLKFYADLDPTLNDAINLA